MQLPSYFILTGLLSVSTAVKTVSSITPTTPPVVLVNSTLDDASRRLDRSYNDTMKGLSLAIAECQRQFKWKPWNCPVTLSSVFSTSYMNNVNRQIAFLQAITSAGITHHVAKMCLKKGDRYCGCGKVEGPFDRSGTFFNCSVNVKFGRRVSAAFLRPYTDTDRVKNAVKRHNEQIGNKYVKETQVMHCKCHGPTGSCTLKTCWLQLGKFREIARILKDKYLFAYDLRRIHQPLRVNDTKRRLNPMVKDSLVYMETSPDYCVRNDSLGVPGTRGRECAPISENVDDTFPIRDKEWERYSSSCREMCLACDYDVREVTSEEKSPCECKFKWCCKVNCRQCAKTVTRYNCA